MRRGRMGFLIVVGITNCVAESSSVEDQFKQISSFHLDIELPQAKPLGT